MNIPQEKKKKKKKKKRESREEEEEEKEKTKRRRIEEEEKMKKKEGKKKKKTCNAMNIPHWIPWKLDNYPCPLSVPQHAPKSITTAVCPIMQSGERERGRERDKKETHITVTNKSIRHLYVK